MADKDYKAFIVEGEAREPQVIDNISKVFFRHGNFKIITLPAGENIYILWKLYISYLMVEALRDFEPGICGKSNTCFVAIEELGEYKKVSFSLIYAIV